MKKFKKEKIKIKIILIIYNINKKIKEFIWRNWNNWIIN